MELPLAADKAGARGVCPRCDGTVPRLYGIPERALTSRGTPGPACYFCFVRIVGIRPTRRQLVPPAPPTSAE